MKAQDWCQETNICTHIGNFTGLRRLYFGSFQVSDIYSGYIFLRYSTSKEMQIEDKRFRP